MLVVAKGTVMEISQTKIEDQNHRNEEIKLLHLLNSTETLERLRSSSNEGFFIQLNLIILIAH
jgi:hypothetical protein